MDVNNLYSFKIIIVGNSGVGKSCLLNQFIYHKWSDRSEPTIGVDYISKTISVNDKPVKLNIWDTAGQETYKSIISSYYRNCSLAMVVYEVTNRASFISVEDWILTIREHDAMPFIIIANKTDLLETSTAFEIKKREVTYHEGNMLAKRYNCIFCETSSKSKESVLKIFNLVAETLVKYSDENILINDYSLKDMTLGEPLIKKSNNYNQNNDNDNDQNKTELLTNKKKRSRHKCCYL